MYRPGTAFPCVLLCSLILCTCASACFEPLLVSVWSQQSSVDHMSVDLSCVLALFYLQAWFLSNVPSLVFYCIYHISMLFFPSAWELMAELPGFVGHRSSLMKELAANSGSSWMPRALKLHLVMLSLIKDGCNL